MRLTKSGVSFSSCQKCERSTTCSRRSFSAVTVADRGSPSSRLISPKRSPGCSGPAPPSGVCTDTRPSMRKKNESPGVHISVSSVPVGVSTIRAMAAIRRSSSSVHSTTNGTRRRWLIRASTERSSRTSRVTASLGPYTGKISARYNRKTMPDPSGNTITATTLLYALGFPQQLVRLRAPAAARFAGAPMTDASAIGGKGQLPAPCGSCGRFG